MSNNTINNSNISELVFVPMPGMGHIRAAVEMARCILDRDQRFTVTVYIIDRDVPKINDYLLSQSLDQPYRTRLTFVTLPTIDPLDPSTPNYFTVLIDLHKPLFKKAVLDRVKSGTPKPVGFVLDMFCTAMIDVASELHIPSYILFTSGANFLNLMFHAQSLADYRGVDVVTELSNPDLDLKVPGFKTPVMSNVIPALFHNESSCRVNVNHSRRYRETKGILVNTFLDLETYAVQTLLDEMSENGKEKIPPVYPIGPVLQLSNDSIHDRDDMDTKLIMNWLDAQPKSSVVFLCFGSMGCFDANQVKEIAYSLEALDHRFLWSLRKPPAGGRARGPPRDNKETFEEALPEGFLDRTNLQGRVIGWAPQVCILAHPAIGGFVSHCGWNSILESIWFGVPLATWPIHSEQQLNAFELVKELGLAVEIQTDFKQEWKTGKAETIIKSEDIKDGISKLMCIDEEMKGKIREMRDKSRKAIQHGGSSYSSLGCFIQHVFDNVAPIS